MDWGMECWERKDELYAPKRKVNNRGSKQHPHIIVGFYSEKMDRSIEYESLAERLYYYFLELDHEVKRYYVQPVEVPIPVGDKKSEDKFWMHVPDVLVFRQGSIPLLYQVKSEENSDDLRLQVKNHYCELYADRNNWKYHVIYPKTLPPTLQRNIRFLKGFLKERYYYDKWRQITIHRLSILGNTTIQSLSESLKDHTDPLLIKPLIFHLIAHGFINLDVQREINSRSEIHLNNHMINTLSEGGVSSVFQSNTTLF
ncbi:MAG TPA: TnsA endonuclease N-terminal domain-containing protein [Paenibacillus sp.]|jgi:hypothetical protein